MYSDLIARASIAFKLEEASGTTAANSGSEGATFNGTIVGSPTFGTAGSVGDCLTFAGTEEVRFTNFASFPDAISKFVIASYFKTSSTAANQNWISSDAMTGFRKFQAKIQTNGDIVAFFREEVVANMNLEIDHTPSVNLLDGNGHKVVWIYDYSEESLRLFIDGAEEDISGSFVNEIYGEFQPEGTIRFGANLTGDMDEVVFDLNQNWSSHEIASYFSGGTGQPSGTTTITSPANGADVVRPNVNFSYSYDDTDQTGFEYQLSWDSGFDFIQLQGDSASSPWNSSYELIDNFTYYYRIRPVNTNGTGAWSSTVSFNTDALGLPISCDFPVGRGVAILDATNLSVPDLIWCNSYESADFPELTQSKDVFFIWSTDHTTPGGCWAGEADSLGGLNFAELGELIGESDVGASYDSPETPTLKRKPDDPFGHTLHLYLHCQRTSNFSQVTLLFTSAGGDSIENITWTARGEVILPDGGGQTDPHSGYVVIHEYSLTELHAWSHWEGLPAPNRLQAHHTSSDGYNWTEAVDVWNNQYLEPQGVGVNEGYMKGLFLYAGQYWQLVKVSLPDETSYFGLRRSNRIGLTTGTFFRFQQYGTVGDEAPRGSLDGCLRNPNGTPKVDSKGFIHVYYTQQDPTPSNNQKIFYMRVNLKLLSESLTAGNTSTAIDTTAIGNGDYSINVISERTEGDRSNSIAVTINNP